MDIFLVSEKARQKSDSIFIITRSISVINIILSFNIIEENANPEVGFWGLANKDCISQGSLVK